MYPRFLPGSGSLTDQASKDSTSSFNRGSCCCLSLEVSLHFPGSKTHSFWHLQLQDLLEMRDCSSCNSQYADRDSSQLASHGSLRAYKLLRPLRIVKAMGLYLAATQSSNLFYLNPSCDLFVSIPLKRLLILPDKVFPICPLSCLPTPFLEDWDKNPVGEDSLHQPLSIFTAIHF